MKICHITITHETFDTRIFKKQCVSLQKCGYEVILVAPHNQDEVVEGVIIKSLFRWESFIERVWKAPKAAIEIIKEIDADLYHFHDPELFPHMLQFAKRTDKKVVWDAHENYADTIFQLNSLKIKPLSWLGAKWFGYMELHGAKKDLAGVVTITEKMAEKYKKKGIRTCVLSNYADLTKFQYDGNLNISRKPRLISSGSHFSGRAVHETAQAFQLIRNEIDAEIVFSGKFLTQELEDDVRNILQDAESQQENWMVEGAVSFNHLINVAIPKGWAGLVLFDTSDPNNRNGLPNRFFECWANGLPVIATRGTQVAELVKEWNGGVVIENNAPKSIANAFIFLAHNKAVRDKMSVNAYRAVREKYNWNTNFQDLKVFYKEIVEKY